MTSYGDHLTCKDLKSTGTIHWNTFEPPIQGGGVDTLAGVLAAGNDANFQQMRNVAGISISSDPNNVTAAIDGHITGAEEIDCQTLRATESFVLNANCITLDFDENAGNTTISGSTVAGQETVCTNLDLRDVSNLFPTSIDDDTLADVLTRGNLANGISINMVGGDVTQVRNFDFAETNGQTNIYGDITPGRPTVCSNLDLTDPSNTFPSGINGDLAATLALGNNAGANSIDMNNQSITNALLLGATNAQIGTAGTPGICSVVGTLTANAMQGRNVYLNNDATNPSAVLEFTGLAGQNQTTEIIGDSSQTDAVANLTKCTYLDLTDGTNALPASESERYEWGGTWTDAKTIFPPPPYANGGTQIPTINQVIFDFNTIDTVRTPGWRYFAPQSDSDCQIDPDDNMGLHEGEYIQTNVDADAWKYAFYADTAATTVAAHSSQIVEFTFPVTYHGYGRIYIGLTFQYLPQGTPIFSAPQFMNQSFRLLMEHEGSALSNNERLNGPTTMRWYIDDFFPTDGRQVRLYPVIRVDDDRHYGRMQVVIGNGLPLYGCNPGEIPDFDDVPPANQYAQNGQLFMRGYPLPTTYNLNANPSVTTSRYFDPPVTGGDPSW